MVVHYLTRETLIVLLFWKGKPPKVLKPYMHMYKYNAPMKCLQNDFLILVKLKRMNTYDYSYQIHVVLVSLTILHSRGLVYYHLLSNSVP